MHAGSQVNHHVDALQRRTPLGRDIDLANDMNGRAGRGCRDGRWVVPDRCKYFELRRQRQTQRQCPADEAASFQYPH